MGRLQSVGILCIAVTLLLLPSCQIFKVQEQDSVPVIDGVPMPPVAQNALPDPGDKDVNPVHCDYPITTLGVKITCVIDGDTVKLENGTRIRLIGIDAPELGDPGSLEATLMLVNLTNQSYIYLEKEVSDTDRYGRLLRNIYVSELFANQIMVQSGWATAWAVPPDTKHATALRQMEQEAKDKKRGLWASH